jgi:hypothetical protein
MSNAGAASLAALIPTRAEASRKNGARSRGPKTPEAEPLEQAEGEEADWVMPLRSEDLEVMSHRCRENRTG